METDPEKMTAYLLGQLSEQDEQAIEMRLADDDELHAQLLAVEDELLCDYGAGKLPDEQRRGVEERLLSSPEALERSRLGAALSRRADAAPVETGDSLWARCIAWLRGPRLAVAGALAAAAVILLVVVNRPGTGDEVASRVVTVSPTALRSAGEPPVVPVEGVVRFRLEVEPGATEGYSDLSVSVGARTIRDVPVSGGVVEVEIDSRSLQPGLLEIELWGARDGSREPIAFYEVMISGSR